MNTEQPTPTSNETPKTETSQTETPHAEAPKTDNIKRKNIIAGIVVGLSVIVLMNLCSDGYDPDDAPFGDDGLAYHIKYCDSGVGEACNRAGNYQTSQKKHSEALRLYKRGCELNAEAACYNLAHKYEYGSGTAVEYLQKSCDLRFGKACTELSTFYYNSDKNRSFEYAQKACDYKDGNGCDRLGTFYLVGNGVAPNRDKAMKLFRKGCNLGGEDACSSYKFHQD